MKKNVTLKSLLTHLAQDAAMPNEIDLWPTIRAHLLAEPTVQQGGNRHTTSSHRLLRLALAALAIIAFAGLTLFTPQGRALAQEVLGLCATTSQTAFPAMPYVQPTVPTMIVPVEPASSLVAEDADMCGPTISATSSSYFCQVIAAEKSLGFEIKVFSKPVSEGVLKGDLAFTSLAADPAGKSVRLIFSLPNGGNLWLSQGLGDFPPAEEPWELVPRDAVQSVQVTQHSGEYLMGDFVRWAGSDQYTWDSTITGTQRLRWKEGDRWFEIRKIGNPPPEVSISIQQADLITLAENLLTIKLGMELMAGNAA